MAARPHNWQSKFIWAAPGAGSCYRPGYYLHLALPASRRILNRKPWRLRAEVKPSSSSLGHRGAWMVSGSRRSITLSPSDQAFPNDEIVADGRRLPHRRGASASSTNLCRMRCRDVPCLRSAPRRWGRCPPPVRPALPALWEHWIGPEPPRCSQLPPPQGGITPTATSGPSGAISLISSNSSARISTTGSAGTECWQGVGAVLVQPRSAAHRLRLRR